MSAGQFAMWLALIAIAVVVALYIGVWWINRPLQPEPLEHGDGEP